MNPKKKPFKPVANFETLTMIEHVEIIAVQSYESECSEDFRSSICQHAQIIADFYQITEFQAILLSVLVTINLHTSSVDCSEIARYFDISGITLAKYLNDIKALVDRQFLRATSEENKKRRRKTQLNSQEYYINRDFYDALLKGKPFEPKVNKAVDIFDFLRTIGQIIRNKEEYENEDQVYVELNSVFKENQHISFLQDLKLFNLDDKSLLLYLLVCSEFVCDPNEDVDLSKAVGFLFPDIWDNMDIRKQFLNGNHPLQQNYLLELEKGSFRNDTCINLTDKSLNMLVGDNKDVFTRTKLRTSKQFQVIRHQDIIEKKLFYSEQDQAEIDFIIDILQPENYQNMMKRLADEGLPQGLCILFFGEAGTSKTQLSLMIAKKTGRNVFNFKISENKSMFYGESQKLVKKAFDHYREINEASPASSLLLLNEADGILSKRRSNDANQGVMQTENAIQTIILNEMEDLKGILIATTNLQNHFDPSFYRRFLIKKEFKMPTAEVRMKIWADKLPWLEEHELEVLSVFEISGAIIENVQRKIVMQRALYGIEHPDLDLIIRYLEEENITKTQQRSRIGFLK